MSQIIKIAALSALLGLSCHADAADKSNSVNVSGSYQSAQATRLGNAMLGYERMWTASVSTEVDVVATRFGTPGLPTTTSYLMFVKPKYYFGAVGNAGMWVPYAALGLGRFVSGQSRIGNPTVVAGFVGAEAAVTESTSFFGEFGAGHYAAQGRSYPGNQVNLGLKQRF